MACLIDRDELIEVMRKSHKYHAETARDFSLLFRDIRLVKEQPTFDAVQVVRCRDCIGKSTWYNDAEYGFVICGISGMYPKSEHDYCSYGERKTE